MSVMEQYSDTGSDPAGGPATAGGDPVAAPPPVEQAVPRFMAGYSVEISPAVAGKINSFADLLPAGTRVYIAMLPGATLTDSAHVAKRLRAEGMEPVPHIAARRLASEAELHTGLRNMAEEAGLREALVIAGGVNFPVGPFGSSMDILATGLLEHCGVEEIGVAGHPEGSPDIPDAEIERALLWKNDYAERTGARLRLVTQFGFDAQPVIAWDRHLRRLGNRLPIHIGIAGPAKLTTLINYARMSGVGPSIKVLMRNKGNLARAATVSAPDQYVTDLAAYQACEPECGITGAHFYSFGGLKRTARWCDAVVSGNFAMKRDKSGFKTPPGIL